MYVISIASWRRRFGPWLRTLIIAAAVLWTLFIAYRWFVPHVPALPASQPLPPTIGKTHNLRDNVTGM